MVKRLYRPASRTGDKLPDLFPARFFGYTFLGDAKKVFSPRGTEGLRKGAAIKVADSLQDPMCIAAAVRKEDTRAFVARRLQA